MSNLWTEKYRPKNLESFEGEAHIKQLMETSILKGFPNLLLYGPPGTGKTTFAHIISKDKLELNASDERGINVIREKIKNYASAINQNRTIILDECENLTEDAQHCLRRVIEDNKYTRFIFITNYLSKIISPLKSRLVKIKFDLKSNSVLENIGKKEGLKMDSKTYSMIFKYCNSDLRRSINVLQGLHPLINNINDLEYSVEDAIGIVPSSILEKFKEITVRTYNKFIEDFIFNGYSVLQLIHQLSNFEVDNDDKNKSKFIIKLSKLEELSVLGCSDEIVLNKLCICKIKIYR